MQVTSDSLPETALVVRKIIRGAPQRLFEAWTQPAQLMKWWGPRGVVCTAAEVDLRVGGRYRLANQFADGKVLWINGEFQAIDAPRRLVYSWRLGESGPAERVTVTFQSRGENTEVTVRHERIANTAMRDGHQQGWLGCLDGLAEYLAPIFVAGP
jgi:uncharacterized protein YndB with AHSA1/START domain